MPRSGCSSPRISFKQRGLAGAVGADQADLVAAQDRRAEIAHHLFVAIGFVDLGQFRDDLAGTLAGRDVEPDLALLFAPRAALAAQLFQPPHPALVARAARLHALADPDFLLRQEFVELGILDFLDFQLFRLARLVGAEIAGKGQQTAAVEFDDAGRNVVEKAAVVGDEQDAALVVAQQAFEPDDGVEVEMVGRFVEQQHVGCADQRAGQRHAFLHAARQGAQNAIPIEVEAVQRGLDPVAQAPGVGGVEPGLDHVHALHQGLVVAAAELRGQLFVFGQQSRQLAHAGRDRIEHRHLGCEFRLLFDIGDLQPLLHDQQAVVQLRQPGQNFQQRRFAAAVAADQADALARFQ